MKQFIKHILVGMLTIAGPFAAAFCFVWLGDNLKAYTTIMEIVVGIPLAAVVLSAVGASVLGE